jgi:hypothetical protein
MTLIEALNYLKDFGEHLEAIISGGGYGYDAVIEDNCFLIGVHLKTIKDCIEGEIFIENFLDLLDYRFKFIYNHPVLNPIFTETNMNYIDVRGANSWYTSNLENIGEYKNEIISSIEETYNVYNFISSSYRDLFNKLYP